jgi:ABC-2 type transport system permease protein
MNRRALTEALRSSAQRVVAERGGLVVATSFYLIIVATLSGLWRVAAGANDGELGGYTALMLTWYIVTSEAATVSLQQRLIEVIGDDVANGTIAVELLRPASVLGVRVAAELGRALPKVLLLWCAGAVLAEVVAGGPPDPGTLVLVAPSLVLALTANLLGQHAFAASTFWLRGAGGVWYLWLKAVFITGGMIIPLELLPDGLERVAFALPFWTMAYAPARLASGHWEPMLLVGQLAWVAVLGVVAHLAFSAGERRLQVVGG